MGNLGIPTALLSRPSADGSNRPPRFAGPVPVDQTVGAQGLRSFMENTSFISYCVWVDNCFPWSSLELTLIGIALGPFFLTVEGE